MTNRQKSLAINGGTPVAGGPFPEPWLGPAAIGEEEVAAVSAVVRSQKLFRFLDRENSYCSKLEGQFRRMTGCPHALAVGGGTAALICGLIGLGIGEGDEVILPGYTYIASASAVLICGAVPVIAEIDESLTLDPDDVAAKITKRTKAIMPVHMRGIPADMGRILAVARKNGLLVIEDCAQACGATYRGRHVGAIGDVGCFSLQQYKIITAGEGGMVVTGARDVYERAAIRHDSAMIYWNPADTKVGPFPGENFRMDEMSGALGSVQFERMAGILARTRSLYKVIHERIRNCPQISPHRSPDPEGDCGITVAFFLSTAEQAKWFAEALRAEGVPADSIYDKGIPDRHIYRHWEYVMEKRSWDAGGWPWTSPRHDSSRTYSPDMCPRTLDILGRTVAVPIAQTYSDQHAQWIADAIWKVAESMEPQEERR